MTRTMVVLAIFMVAAVSCFAANARTTQVLTVAVTEVAMIGTGPDSPISLTLVAPSTAGDPIPTVTNSRNRLVYTSVLPPKGERRAVTAQISGGSAPKGTQLTLSAARAEGHGGGRVGEPTGELVLGEAPQELITGVGSAYTGSREGDGHVLTYGFGVTDMEALVASDTEKVEVTLTLTDAG